MADLVTLGRRESRIISLVLILCAIFGFLIAYFYNKITFGPPKQDKADVSFSASKTTVKKGENFEVQIILDSKNTPVEAATFVVNFDPKYLLPTEVKEGKYFGAYREKSIGETSVKISGMAFFKGDTIYIPKGKGVVGTINLQAKDQAGKTKLTFDREKTVVAASGKNILRKTGELTISIK